MLLYDYKGIEKKLKYLFTIFLFYFQVRHRKYGQFVCRKNNDNNFHDLIPLLRIPPNSSSLCIFYISVVSFHFPLGILPARRILPAQSIQKYRIRTMNPIMKNPIRIMGAGDISPTPHNCSVTGCCSARSGSDTRTDEFIAGIIMASRLINATMMVRKRRAGITLNAIIPSTQPHGSLQSSTGTQDRFQRYSHRYTRDAGILRVWSW